jgi:hypothetical protein
MAVAWRRRTVRASGGYDIRAVHEVLCHAGVSTTMIDAHALNRGEAGVKSPPCSGSLLGLA